MKSDPKLEPVKSSKMVIRFGYNDIMVLDHKDGIKLVESLEKAEQLDDHYGSSSSGTIKPMKKGSVSIEIMSAKEYEDRKMAGLLDISYDDFLNPEKEEVPF